MKDEVDGRQGGAVESTSEGWLPSVLNDTFEPPPPVAEAASTDDESIPDTFDDTGPPPAAEVKIDSEMEMEVEVEQSEALWPWPDEAAEAEAAARLRLRWPDEDVEAAVRTSRQILPCLDASRSLEQKPDNNEERNDEMDQTIDDGGFEP